MSWGGGGVLVKVVLWPSVAHSFRHASYNRLSMHAKRAQEDRGGLFSSHCWIPAYRNGFKHITFWPHHENPVVEMQQEVHVQGAQRELRVPAAALLHLHSRR